MARKHQKIGKMDVTVGGNGGDIRVLVVEAEAITLMQSVEVLQEAEYSVHSAATAGEALQIAATTALDVAVVDLRLPDMDGVHLAERLREMCPALHLIAVTGFPLVKERKECAEAGFDGYFEKPIAVDLVVQEILKRTRGAGGWKDGHVSGIEQRV